MNTQHDLKKSTLTLNAYNNWRLRCLTVLLALHFVGCGCLSLPKENDYDPLMNYPATSYGLSDAVEKNDTDKVKKILAKPNKPDLGPALEKSIKAGNLAMLKLLVEEGKADVNTVLHSFRGSLVEEAINYNKPELLQYLLEKGATIPHSTLTEAIEKNKPEVVSLLVKHGADINEKEYSSSDRALDKAINSDKPALLKAIVGNIDLTERKGKSVVFKAIEKRNKAIFNYCLEKLTEQTVDLDEFRNDRDATLLEEVFNNGDPDIIECLLEREIDIRANVTYFGKRVTPFGIAMRQGNVEITEKILKKLAEIGPEAVKKAVNRTLEIVGYNQTPLYYAANNHKQKLVRLLLNHGAMIDQKVQELTNRDSDIYNMIYGKEDDFT